MVETAKVYALKICEKKLEGSFLAHLSKHEKRICILFLRFYRIYNAIASGFFQRKI